MARTTAFSRTFLPTWDNKFSFHPCNLLHTPFLMQLRLAFLFLPTTAGNPRYFSYSLIFKTPRKFRISSFVSSATTLLKKRVVLSRLICCPRLVHTPPRCLELLPNLPILLDKIASYHLQKRNE